LSLIVPIVVITAARGGDPEAAGETAGTLSVAPLLAGVAVGFWARFATRRWHVVDYLLRFALCTVAFFGLNALGRSLLQAVSPRVQPAPVHMTDGEKRNLYVSGGWVHHSNFDFILPVGPQFKPAPDTQNEINEKLAGLPGTFVWALEAQNPDRLVLIFLAKGMGTDKSSFRAMARGISTSAGKQAAQVLEDEMQWSRRAKEFRYGIRLADDRYAQTRCVPSDPERQPPYVVCVQTLGPDRNGLDALRNQLVIRK